LVTVVRRPEGRGPIRHGRTELTDDELTHREHLRRHVGQLAGDIGERNVWRPAALDAAAGYIAHTLRGLGFSPTFQQFEAAGRTVRNIDATIVGVRRPQEIVIVGAHYDTVIGCPGANDNATGTAAMLEIARTLAARPAHRTVRFLAFVNEEPPFFQSGQMGSFVYARRAREQRENVVAMLSLETIGYYADAPGSQHYPVPRVFSLLYPSRANFIAFVSNFYSARLLRHSLRIFRAHASVPSKGAAVPAGIAGIGWSDHWSFWQHGYPALMVTDTALFRYPHYHTPSDTADKIDYDRTARVVHGLSRVVAELGGVY